MPYMDPMGLFCCSQMDLGPKSCPILESYDVMDVPSDGLIITTLTTFGCK